MKKIISLSLVTVMVFAMFAPLVVSAGVGNSLVWKTFDEPDDYAYSFAVVGDIQNLTEPTSNATQHEQVLYGLFNWIGDNAVSKNIKYCIGLGDVTNNITTDGYTKAVNAYNLIKGEVPFSIIRGNHDVTVNNYNAKNNYDTYITDDLFEDQNIVFYDDSSNYTDGGTTRNSYEIINIGSTKYLFLNIDYSFKTDVLAWADSVVKSNKDCRVIVSTHGYSGWDFSLYNSLDSNGRQQNSGATFWNNFVTQNENIVLVLQGHTSYNNIAYNTNKRMGVHGNKITELLIDPQQIDKENGGLGMVAMLYFSRDGRKVDVRYYSTARNQIEANSSYDPIMLDLSGVDGVQASTEAAYRTVLEEHFNDPTKAAGYLSGAVGNNKPSAVGDNFNISNGVLDVTTSYVHGGQAMRLPLYNIPDGAEEYSIEAKFDIVQYVSSSRYTAFGLVYEDNLVNVGTFGAFLLTNGSHINCLQGFSNGGWSYGNDAYHPNYPTVQTRLPAGNGYTAKCTVSLVNNTVTATVYNADGSVFATATKTLAVSNKNVGLFFNDVNVQVDYVKVQVKDRVEELTLSFEENFDDSSKASELLAGAVGKGDNASSADFEISDGKLNVEIGYAHPKDGIRIPLYEISNDVTQYSVEAKVKINSVVGTHSSDQYAGVGLIYADNLKNCRTESGAFHMFILEPLYWNRLIGWNGETNSPYKAVNQNDIYEAVIKYTVSLIDNTITAEVYSVTGTLLMRVSDVAQGTEKYVGLFFNDGQFEVDYVKVYTSRKAQLVLDDDFSIAPDLYGSAADTTLGVTTSGVTNDGFNVDTNGEVDNQEIPERNGVRANLLNVSFMNSFTASLDFTVNEKCMDNAYVSLLLADNKVTDAVTYSESQNMYTFGSDSSYSMIKLVPGAAGSGAYTFGSSDYNVVDNNIVLSATGSYNIKVYVCDTSNTTECIAQYTITDKTTNTVVYGQFVYNPLNLDEIIGIAANGVDVTFESLKVWEGDATQTEFAG